MTKQERSELQDLTDRVRELENKLAKDTEDFEVWASSLSRQVDRLREDVQSVVRSQLKLVDSLVAHQRNQQDDLREARVNRLRQEEAERRKEQERLSQAQGKPEDNAPSDLGLSEMRDMTWTTIKG